MATELLLPGLRPHELAILERLCRLAEERLDDETPVSWNASAPISRDALLDAIRADFPQADLTDAQFDSAISVLDYSYFTGPNRKRFGNLPLVETLADDDQGEPAYRLSSGFVNMLAENRTFRIFLADPLRTCSRRRRAGDALSTMHSCMSANTPWPTSCDCTDGRRRTRLRT